jgi:hypothetical protein
MRDAWLRFSDAELLADCDVDCFRASGPGGQKRNKTDSAVRVRHRPSGLAARAVESRSQHQNRAHALRRLRETLAIELRCQPSAAGRAMAAALIASPPRSEKARRPSDYLVAIAALLDELEARELAVGETAAALGVSTGALAGTITADPRVHRKVNEERARRGLRPLR